MSDHEPVPGIAPAPSEQVEPILLPLTAQQMYDLATTHQESRIIVRRITGGTLIVVFEVPAPRIDGILSATNEPESIVRFHNLGECVMAATTASPTGLIQFEMD